MGNPTVTINGITLYGAAQHADGVYQVGPKFFQDWYSVSPTKTPLRERPAQDGAFGRDRVYRSALPLSLSGWARGSNWPTLMTALAAAVGTGAPIAVSVTDAVGVSTRTVTVDDFVPYLNPGANRFEFDLTLTAEDPNRYGATQTVSTGVPTSGTGMVWPQVYPVDWGSGGNSARATAINSGSRPSPLKMTVAGGLSGGVDLVEVTTGAHLTLARTIPLGSSAIFDAALGRVYLDQPSNDITGFLSAAEWSGFQIPKNGQAVVQFNPLGTQTGTPTLTLQWAPAN